MLSPGPISGNAALSPPGAMRAAMPYAVASAAIASITILGALGFEHIGGYLPCHLCLLERIPYYAGIPAAVLAVIAILLKAPRAVVVALFAIFAALMVYNTGLAAYHSGVEWGFWEGPASCAPSIRIESAADMLNQLANAHAPSCTEAALRVFGISLAGYNVLISAFLAALATVGARKAWRAA